MSTTTTRLGLYKTASDGSELVNVVTDLLNNWDAIDLAMGFRPVTSITRPSTPYGGQGIIESDTNYRTLVHNGTSPASAGWIEIPNSAATYSGQIIGSRATDSNTLRLANTFAGGNSTPTITTEHATSTGTSYGTRQAGDSFDRFRLRADGRIDIGSGAGARDTNLYRNGVGLLRTDGAFSIGGAATLNSTLAVTGAATLGSTLAVTGNTSIGGNLTVSGVGLELFAIKSGPTSITSSTSPTADPHLTLAIPAAGTYDFILKLFVDTGSNTANLLVQFTFPTGTCHFMGQGSGGLGAGTTVGTAEWVSRQGQTSGTTASIAYSVSTSASTGVVLTGTLVATASGSLTLRWAQFVSSGTATTLLAGSSFRARRMV